MTLQGHNYIKFNVTTCEKAQIALSYVPNLVSVFSREITLGRNGSRGLSLREAIDGEEKAIAAESETLVKCSETQAFWIWWRIGIFSVGRGTVVGDNKQELLSYPFDFGMTQLNSAQFRTPQGTPGEWIITDTGCTLQLFIFYYDTCLELVKCQFISSN